MTAIDSIAKALASAGLGEAEKEALVSFSDGTQRKLNTKEDGKPCILVISASVVFKVVCTEISHLSSIPPIDM